MALSWILQDQALADRFLALTGLSPDRLRNELGNRETMAAVLDFLAGNDGDLMAASDALGIAPERMASAAQTLSGRRYDT